jgi:LysM repeat protein
VKGETLSGLYFARIGAAKEFIRLLWECSVVGTGGFYLNYVNADNGAGLPQNLFADSNGATLWLIIILSSQCRAKSPDRNLYGFTNAVLVQDNIDAGQANIFTEAADNSDITKGATVPPGYVGFQLTRPNPESETPGPEQKTRSLYSLLSYRVVENDFFNGSPESLPIGPTYHEKNNANRDNQHAWLNTDEKNWQYHHVVPIYRFAKANPLPHCNALPSGTGTPYAGIAKDPATQRLAWVELGFTFRDLFGNSKTPEPKMPCLPIPVGYFDRLIGFSQWPGASAAYTFNSADDSADGAPRLQVIFDLQITKYLPGPGTPFENAVKTASAHSEKFRQIYYQIEQEDVRFHLRTSLDQPLPGKEPQAYAVQKTILRHFVRAAYLFLSATQQLKAYEHRIEKGQTLEDIANAYAVKVIDLGKANQTTGSDSLFSEDLNIPKFQVVRHGETLSDIVSGTELDVERLAKNNRYIPLNPGKKISGYTVLTGDTLETLSAKPNLGSIDQIARNNAFLPNLFEAGTALYLNSEPSPPEASLEDMADMYGITPAQLCDFNRQTPLKAGTSLRIPDLVFVEQPDLLFTAYLSGDGDTLCQIAEKYRQPPIKLVQLNLKLQGLFAPDQPITVGSHTVVTEAADTFISLLGKFKEVGLELSLTDLAKTIQGQPGLIPAGAFFVCPLPRAAAGDSIEKLALKFSATVESLARANSSLQGFLRRGAEIKIERNIEGQKQVFSTVARSYDTLNTLASRLCGKLQKIQNRSDRLPEPTIEEIAVENRLNTDLLVPDQEFILPPNPVIFSAKIAPHYPDTLFPVTVALEMTRDADLVDPEFKDVSEVWLNRTMIAPKTSTVTSGTLSLREFAKNFEQAFPGLKAATGIKKELDEDRSASGRLWAVNFGESGIRSFTIQGDRPRFFALKPLSTSLMAKKDVPIVSYRSGHGLDDQPKKHNFQTIDLDKWAQDFLSAVDRILSLEYAIPAFMLDSKAYEKIVAAKATIAEALKGQVDEILEPKGDKHREADLIDAREALYQRMLIKLSHAYETDTLIQLPVAVESNYLDKKTAPRFFGKPVSINETIAGPNPDYQLATAKVPLADGNQTVNFLFKVTSAEEQTKVPLNLIYQISEFEYDIQDNKGIEDYEASSWLSFILPIGQSPRQPLGINPHIGAIEVPIPLRCYPVPPTLVFQEGHAWWHPPKSTSGQPEIEQVKLWDYGITYEHQAAAQDSTYLKVVFNDVKNPDKRTKARKPDLFDTLAQFTAVYPDLRKDLEFLPTIQEGQGGDIATKAVQSFARLAIAVAEAWQLTSASRHDEKPDSRLIFNYSLDMKKTESSSLETLTLHAAPENPSVMWPRVFILIPDRQKVEQPLEMPIIVQTSQESVYKYPEASNTLGPFGSLRQKFVFEKCDVVHLQNAWGGVWITRNEHLIDSTHTNAGFVYRTPLVRFRNPMVPFLEYDEIIPINFSSGLKASLRSLFQSLFAATGKTWDKYSERSLTLTCSYDYELVASTPGETPIISRVPVLFQPRHYFKLDPEKPDWGDQRASFVEELCQAIETWEKNNPACRNGGSYVFEINLYSTLEPSLTQPLLKLKSLSYNLESDHFTKAP